MANYTPEVGATVINPVQNGPVAAVTAAKKLLGGRGHTTQMQQGVDFSQMDPNDIALKLGLPGYGPSYDSNNAGSFQRGYDALIGQFTPDQLLARYGNPNAGQGQFGASQLDQSNANAYKGFQSIIGRAPTADEFAQLLPIFQGANGQTLGNAWIANYKKQIMQNPNDPLNQGKVSQYTPQIQQVFKSMIGRDATQDEISHFGGLFATGNVDAYQLQDFLRGTPEFQTQEDTKFRSGLDQQLQDSDLSFFNRAKQNVMSQFMQNGTNQSSALDSALTDLMGQISEKRSGFLANLSSQQYGGNKDLALGNYKNSQNQFLQEQNYNRGNAMNQQNYLQGRGDELTNYGIQQKSYQDYLNSQKPNNLFNYLTTGANVVNAGANLFGGR